MTFSTRPLAHRVGRTAALGLLFAVTVSGCLKPESEAQSLRFAQDRRDVEVTFHGELSDAELFGQGRSLLDQFHPKDNAGKPRGDRHTAHPG
jgi:hypothetical protein